MTRIVLVADGRSPITRGWLAHLVERGEEVHLISSYPVDATTLPGVRTTVVPLAFAGGASAAGDAAAGGGGGVRGLVRRRVLASRGAVRAALWARNAVGPVVVLPRVKAVRAVIAEERPDVVHALRIPYEGLVAARAVPEGVPLVLSVWGNDFTLHAAHNPMIRREIRSALRRADAVVADCHRDIRLAERLGMQAGTATAVLPGGGGIDPAVFFPGPADAAMRAELGLGPGDRLVLNPRGVRKYVNTEAYLAAAALLSAEFPEVVFACLGTERAGWLTEAIARLGGTSRITMVPSMAFGRMAELFRAAEVVVSPSSHDGIPNSMIEALACGAFPVAGDIASIREWIVDGENGLLCDPNDPAAIATAMRRALVDKELRARARTQNFRIVRERALGSTVRVQMATFYTLVTAESESARARIGDPPDWR